MRTLIVGDIHGCYTQFRQLLEKVDFEEEKDRLVSLGDLMDRGEMSYEVLMYVRGLKERMKERCVLLMGNHEWMAIHGRLDPLLRRMWYDNGGKATVDSFEQHGDRLANYTAWMRRNMVLYYKGEGFQCVHAGIVEEEPEKNTEATLLWARSAVEENRYTGRLTVIGHTPLKDVIHFTGSWKDTDVVPYGVERELPKQGMMCIDTGCVFHKRLTGMIVEGGKYVLEGVDY